jgi:hypothetical protein
MNRGEGNSPIPPNSSIWATLGQQIAEHFSLFLPEPPSLLFFLEFLYVSVILGLFTITPFTFFHLLLPAA